MANDHHEIRFNYYFRARADDGQDILFQITDPLLGVTGCPHRGFDLVKFGSKRGEGVDCGVRQGHGVTFGIILRVE